MIITVNGWNLTLIITDHRHCVNCCFTKHIQSLSFLDGDHHDEDNTFQSSVDPEQGSGDLDGSGDGEGSGDSDKLLVQSGDGSGDSEEFHGGLLKEGVISGVITYDDDGSSGDHQDHQSKLKEDFLLLTRYLRLDEPWPLHRLIDRMEGSSHQHIICHKSQ